MVQLGAWTKKCLVKKKDFVSEINVYYDKEKDNSYTKRTSIVSSGKSWVRQIDSRLIDSGLYHFKTLQPWHAQVSLVQLK